MNYVNRTARLPRHIARLTVLAMISATFAASAVMAEPTVRLPGDAVHKVQLRAPTGPKPGDCKANYVTVMGSNPVHAVAVWQSTVSTSMGANWANWVGAQNKKVVPQSTTQVVATGQPCFYHPVP